MASEATQPPISRLINGIRLLGAVLCLETDATRRTRLSRNHTDGDTASRTACIRLDGY